jgi:aminoglycoside phosphotransferase (APT) family kinase protein
MPAAEVGISAELVRRLVEAQHPELAHLPVELMAHGWDNAMFRVGGDLVARLPRREMAVRPLVNEQRWLPVLAPALPLPVPAPVRIGQPGFGYPWPWSIVPFLPGEAASQTPPADPGEAAVSLGRFLAALHAPAALDAPLNQFRGVPLAHRTEQVMANLELASGQLDQAAFTAEWKTALAAPTWDGPPVWLHGDLHPANVLVVGGRVSGVIDFGDITSGDPAIDLSVAWMMLPAGCHGAFQHAYDAAGGRPSGDPVWARARGWALVLALVFLAHSADNPRQHAIGKRTMAALLG